MAMVSGPTPPGTGVIAAARRELVLAELIAYEPPLYQVLALEGGQS